MDYLVFRLYGAMASWGEVAVGEVRHSAAYPSKSAILGLLGAALGICRDDDAGQSDLVAGYTTAVKVLSTGSLLIDYHTVQAPGAMGKFRYRSRRDELIVGRERLNTLLSSREYRTDACAVVAIAPQPEARWSLAELKAALCKPRFHLYLGRKSCPLGAPLNARQVSADNFRQALDNYEPGALLSGQNLPQWQQQSRWLPEDRVVRYYWEGSMAAFSEPVAGFNSSQVQVLRRHDEPASRRRWQFQPRCENLWMYSREDQ